MRALAPDEAHSPSEATLVPALASLPLFQKISKTLKQGCPAP
jgi:hypothetical protein